MPKTKENEIKRDAMLFLFKFGTSVGYFCDSPYVFEMLD